MDVDRRDFLRGGLGAAGALLLGRYARPGAAGALRPRVGPASRVARPTVRLGFGAFGFPSPFASNGGPGYQQMSLIYDTLLWKDGSGKLRPWLAKSVQRSADGLVFTFELRDVKWSDGMPLTPDDVVFTFDYYKAQESLSPPIIIQPPRGVAKVTATGPKTVEVTLDSPMVTFTEQVAGALPIIPQHVWSSVSGDPSEAQDLSVLVGSGAFRLDSYNGDQGALLYIARDDYFLGRPFVKRIEMNPTGDELAALMAGDIDAGGSFTTGLRPEALAPFRNDASFGVISEKGNFTSPLYWNLKRGGALADAKFRQACARAINRKDIVQRFTGGNGEPGNPGFLAPTNPFYVKVKDQYAFDRKAADRLLDAAGYKRGGGGARQGPDGAPLSFELLTANDPQSTGLADVVKASLNAVGIELTIKAVQIGPQLFGTKLSGNYDMAILVYPGPAAGGPNADPDLLRQLFSSKSGSGLTAASGYQNAEFDDLAEKQLTTSDEAERKKIVAQMQEIVARDIPVLPLYYEDTFQIFRKKVLDSWYFTPGEFPVALNNRQQFITGRKTGLKIRPAT